MRHGERLSGERDCGQAAAVILLAAQAGPAIAEEAVLLGGGVAAGAFDRGKAEPAEAVRDVARQIEQEMAGPRCRHEEGPVFRTVRGESSLELRADLRGGRRDAGADAGAAPIGAGAEPAHPRDRRLPYPGERAAPAAMRTADDATPPVGDPHPP